MRIPLLTYALIALTGVVLAGVLGFWVFAGMAAVVAKFMLVALLMFLALSFTTRKI